jgi:hypothetical protein
MMVLMMYNGRNGNGYQPKPPPPPPPPKRLINEDVKLGDWYLFGCFWCVFCLGVAVGGIIIRWQ